MKIQVYNQNAESTGEIEISDQIFAVKPSLHLLAEAVRAQANNARKGLAHTKTRGDVSGGGKKPWRQKGTGRARAGSTRSPLWRHGGVTFGPRSDRNWSLKINKKAKTKALFMSLSDKAKDGRLIVVEGVNLETPKTKEFIKFMQAFQSKMDILGKRQMLVLPKKDDSLVRASRNLQAVTTTLATSLNVTDILKADSMFILKDSLPVIEKTYLKATAEQSSQKPQATKSRGLSGNSEQKETPKKAVADKKLTA
ncbi:TPA: 50S ribosomal protein L4 [Patescibacteria group bacterium]|jgi:large subunit ribosomal protein L4|nr:50S ribosomal protein L4 [Patescibacteria group bacterium]